MIICPYHAWTYTLAGELRAAGSFKKVPGFDFGSWGLARLPVTEWHGLVFVDTSGGSAGSLGEALAKLDEIIAPYEPERLVTAGRHSYDAAANWKILTENYHECYHCPSIHPELCRVSPPKSGENYASDGAWVGGWMDLRDGMATMSLDGASGGVPLRGLDAQGLRTVIYVNILPNVLLSLHPDYVMTHRSRRWPRTRPGSSARGRSPPRRWLCLPSIRVTRWSSGTSPTGRTGARASRSSAGWPRRRPHRDRWRPTRTRCTRSSAPSPGATWARSPGAR